MACPNRKNDERIIAEIKRRKDIRKNYSTDEEFEIMIFKNNITEIIYAVVQDRIQSIIKIGVGVWEVKLTREK